MGGSKKDKRDRGKLKQLLNVPIFGYEKKSDIKANLCKLLIVMVTVIDCFCLSLYVWLNLFAFIKTEHLKVLKLNFLVTIKCLLFTF